VVMTKETSLPYLAGCDVAVNLLRYPELARFRTNVTEALYHPLKYDRDLSEYVFSDIFSNMVNTCRKHDMCFICKSKLFDENQLEAHYQQYHQISMNEGLLPDGILPSAGWDQPEPSWFDFSWFT